MDDLSSFLIKKYRTLVENLLSNAAHCQLAVTTNLFYSGESKALRLPLPEYNGDSSFHIVWKGKSAIFIFVKPDRV